MFTDLLLLVFILGFLVGVVCVEIYRQRRLEKQWETERHYEMMLWKQLNHYRELLQINNNLLTTNTELKNKYLALQQKHEKTLAILN